MKKLLIGLFVVVVLGGGAWYAVNRGSTPTSQTQPSASVSVSPVSSGPAQATPDNRCIITIDGQKYDVTTFRNQHPGGDVFKCGTDMSAAFHAQHGDGAKQLQMIQNLKVN